MICKAVLMKDYFILLVIRLLEELKMWHFQLGKKAKKIKP